MWSDVALGLVKANLNITQDVRDGYLTAVLNGVVDELSDVQGIDLDPENPYHVQFVVDMTAWRYRSRGETGAMPQHLQYRLHNLVLHDMKKQVDGNGS